MGGGDLGQQRHIGGGRRWFTAAPQYGAAVGLPFSRERIGDTDAIGLSIIDDIGLLVPKCLVEVVRARRTLVIVRRGNAEVRHLP